uniref:DUF7041 domain-containing protein n=1 Tax=Heliothis virescens TaxID=7102 RepID=A0A2A4K6C7_HELVI
MATGEQVSSVSTSQRIPLIWRDRIRLWFAQFEAIMSPQKKGDQVMYEVLVGQLEHLDEISDIILRPPEKNRYETLKNRLLQVYDESEQRQKNRYETLKNRLLQVYDESEQRQQTHPTGAVAAISVPPPPRASTSSSSIEAKIEMLIEEIAELKARDRRSFDRHRSRSSSRTRQQRAPRGHILVPPF